MLYFKGFIAISVFCIFLSQSSAKIIPADGVPFTVVVYDGTQSTPLQHARVTLRRKGVFVAGAITDISGRADFRDVQPGWYGLSVRYVDYTDFSDSILIDKSHTVDSISMKPVQREELIVGATKEVSITSVDVKSGNQIFESETYHAAPTARMTNLVQENMLGASRAPTGEVHIRGQHGEFTYYVDGIPVPLGVFGGLNEVVDPKVIERAVFYTGGFPAEYGGQMAAIIDVQNRVPSGKAHLDFSTYAGSYLNTDNTFPDSLGINAGKLKPINSNGQSLSVSDHIGKLGVFLSGSRQETDRRIDAPLPYIYHDHGFDYFLYGKIDYLANDADYVTANFNYGKTLTQIPFDPFEEGVKDDAQNTTNAFQSLSYFRILSRESEKESNLFLGVYAREGGLIFTPGNIDAHDFRFASDSTKGFILAEDRSFTTIGMRLKYDQRIFHELQITGGINFSATSGRENFTSLDTLGKSGPQVLTNYKGSDLGTFAQAEIHPFEWTSFDLGIRYDRHLAPDVEAENQLSPRIKWNFLLDDNCTAYLYYGKLFMPNNIEGLRSIASTTSSTPVPTLAEREEFYEAAFMYNFDFGLRSKIAYFRKVALPGVDDQTIGSSAIKTPVNIATVKTSGIECGISFSDPSTLFSGYANISVIHAYGSGTISGGFLSLDDAGIATDLDHDQRLSSVISLKYQPQNWFADLTANYGSGLTNGNADIAYKTGLFDFNQGAHTTPSWMINLSAGYTFLLSGSSSIEPSLYINNLFDHKHLLKGAFFSGAAWEEPRNVVLKVAVHV